MSSDNAIIDVEFQQLSRNESQVRGEVDMQVTTARKYPRSVKRFKEHALSLATLDEDTAASCFYSLARGGKPIEGPSARLAEIVAASWGNIRSQASVVDVDAKFVTAKGTCWDLENNTAVSVEVQRRITGKDGRRFSDDMIVVTSNAACSIALRNAVFKVVPMAMVKPIYDAARQVAIGDVKTLSSRRQKAFDHFGKMGVKAEKILAKLERESIEDVTLDDLAILIGLTTAIKDGDTSIDEAFASELAKDKPSSGSKSEELASKLKKTEQPKTSHIAECESILKELAIPCIDANPENTLLKYELPNGEFLTVADVPPKSAPGQHVVPAMDDDAVTQVRNIVERASKKR